MGGLGDGVAVRGVGVEGEGMDWSEGLRCGLFLRDAGVSEVDAEVEDCPSVSEMSESADFIPRLEARSLSLEDA